MGGSAGPPQQYAPPPQHTTTTAVATPPRASSTAHSHDESPKWCWTPLSAPKGVLSIRTYPGNWVGRPVSYNITRHFLRKRLRVRQRRRHEGAASPTARVGHPCGAGRPCVRHKAYSLCAPTQVVEWVGLRATTPRLWAHSWASSTILVTRRGCAQWNSLVAALRPQLKSCAEEEGRTVAEDRPTHPIIWAGAQRKYDFGRILGLRAPFRWRRGCEWWNSHPRRHLNGAGRR